MIYAEHTLSKCADATKQGEVVIQGCAAIHMDLSRLDRWRSLMKFSKGKGSVVHPEENSPTGIDLPSTKELCRKGPGILMESKGAWASNVSLQQRSPAF